MNEHQQLNKLVKKAYPKLTCHQLKQKQEEYWRRVCVNWDKHRPKEIKISEFNQVKLALQQLEKANKTTIDTFWNKIKKVPQNQQRQNPQTTNTIGTVSIMLPHPSPQIHQCNM